MANPKSRVIPQIFNLYLIIMAVHCVDVFNSQLMGDSTVFGNNLYGHLIGIICIIIACMVKKRDIRTLGVIVKPKRMLKGAITGGLLSLGPIAVTAVLFIALYVITGNEAFKVAFLPPNINYSNYNKIITTLIYALTSIVSVLLMELFFRSYVIKAMRAKYTFFDANIFQAALCVPVPIINHFKNIFLGKYENVLGQLKLMAVILLFYIVHEFITGIKWGLLARVSKDIWVVFFDHYFYKVIAFSLFFSQSKITNYQTMVKLLIVQIISFIVVWFYYKKKLAEKEKKKLEYKLKQLEQQQSHGAVNMELEEKNTRHAKNNEAVLENFSPDSIHKKVSEYSNKQSHGHHYPKHDMTSQNDDKISDLSESRKMGYFEQYKKKYLGTIGIHCNQNLEKTSEEENPLMDFKDVKINEFYSEYVKEIDRQNNNQKEDLRKKIEKS